jgi:NADH dehydrogenase
MTGKARPSGARFAAAVRLAGTDRRRLWIPLSGPLAKAVSRGYHLAAMPANRLRTAVDWVLDAVLPRQCVQLGLVRSGAVPLDSDAPELPHIGT